MTARSKAKGRASLLARLEAAEVREAERREEVRAANWELLQEARAMLRPTDRAAFDDARILEEDPAPEDLALMGRMEEECRALGLTTGLPVAHAAKEEAQAWEAELEALEEGQPLTPPPAGRVADFCAYFELCALWCEDEATKPDRSEDLRRLARWSAALWRFEANLCQLLDTQA